MVAFTAVVLDTEDLGVLDTEDHGDLMAGLGVHTDLIVHGVLTKLRTSGSISKNIAGLQRKIAISHNRTLQPF